MINRIQSDNAETISKSWGTKAIEKIYNSTIYKTRSLTWQTKLFLVNAESNWFLCKTQSEAHSCISRPRMRYPNLSEVSENLVISSVENVPVKEEEQ
jgi:hypothetical protein